MITQTQTHHNFQQEANSQDAWLLFMNTQLSHENEPSTQTYQLEPLIKSFEQAVIRPDINILVEQALELNPYVDSYRIRVLAQGSSIILSGKVKSWFQKEEAGRVAKLASGNLNIINDIAISYSI